MFKISTRLSEVTHIAGTDQFYRREWFRVMDGQRFFFSYVIPYEGSDAFMRVYTGGSAGELVHTFRGKPRKEPDGVAFSRQLGKLLSF